MHHDVEVHATPEEVARAAAVYVAARARDAVTQRGRFAFAVSGGQTPWAMFNQLAGEAMPWDKTVIYQVDERVAPDGDPARNLAHLQAALKGAPADVQAMPVGDLDLDAAAGRYADSLPDQFDLVHLGLGPDGHTASLVPGDPVLGVQDRLVALTQPYQDHRRMTLTYPALARARQLLWLVTGIDKETPLRELLAGDTSIPAGRVEADRSLVVADGASAPSRAVAAWPRAAAP